MRAMGLLLVISGLMTAAPASAEMRGGLPVGEVAPDGTVTPLGGTPQQLSVLQGQRLMLLQFFRHT